MPGTIIFKPIEANITTKDKDLSGKMDPYCLFHVGNQKIKGQVCKSGGNHPVWNDEVCIDVKNEPICTIDIKDKDMLIDQKLGTFEVDLGEIECQGRLRKWYPFFHKNEPAGEILLESYCPGGKGNVSYPTQGNVGMPLSQGGSQTSYPQGNVGIPLSQGGIQTAYPQGNAGIPLSQGSNQNAYPQTFSTQDQYGQEALMRGVAPLKTQQDIMGSNVPQSGGNMYSQGGSQGLSSQQPFRENQNLQNQGLQSNDPLRQNLTETPYFSGTDPLVYSGESMKNNLSKQMPFGHGHHTSQDPRNPLNSNQNLSEDNFRQY